VIITDVSNEPVARPVLILYPEDGSTSFPRNVGSIEIHGVTFQNVIFIGTVIGTSDIAMVVQKADHPVNTFGDRIQSFNAFVTK
jgi:hypothetical protein